MLDIVRLKGIIRISDKILRTLYGAAIAGFAKLVYNFFARKMRKKYSGKILKLTEELLGEERPQ